MQSDIFIYKKEIDRAIVHFLDEKRRLLTLINPWGDDAVHRLEQFVKGGKSVRGNLLIHIAHAYGAPITEDLFFCAGAIELVHSGFLAHDDIMDNDRLRRGHYTLFVQYEKQGGLTADRRRAYGQSMAMCVGDLSFFLANELVCQIKNTKLIPRLLLTMSQEFAAVSIAQMQDVSFGYLDRIPSEEEVLSLYRYKTARYTFSLPFIVGATIAQASNKEQAVLEKLGEELGILFQIHDDMLNLFGDSKQTGKPVGSDLQEHKKTLAYVSLYAAMTKEERIKFERPRQKNDEFVAYAYRLLEKHHIKEIMEQNEEVLTKRANDLVAKLSVSEEEKKKLRALIEFVKERSV